MTSATATSKLILGLEHAGMLMTPEEFDAVEEYDESYRYELIHGLLAVSPLPSPEETGPNEYLGTLLLVYMQTHARGKALDGTLPQQYVRTSTGRRIADRLLWTGLGRGPNRNRDVPTIAVEFVSAGRRNRERDYVEKRQEYMAIGIQEYWILDRFRRTMTVIRSLPGGPQDRVVPESKSYRTPLLPGFKLQVADVLAVADRWAEAERGGCEDPWPTLE